MSKRTGLSQMSFARAVLFVKENAEQLMKTVGSRAQLATRLSEEVEAVIPSNNRTIGRILEAAEVDPWWESGEPKHNLMSTVSNLRQRVERLESVLGKTLDTAQDSFANPVTKRRLSDLRVKLEQEE